jgi:hypothetical protein
MIRLHRQGSNNFDSLGESAVWPWSAVYTVEELIVSSIDTVTKLQLSISSQSDNNLNNCLIDCLIYFLLL